MEGTEAGEVLDTVLIGLSVVTGLTDNIRRAEHSRERR